MAHRIRAALGRRADRLWRALPKAFGRAICPTTRTETSCRFKVGDRVVVTNPEPPTRHIGGETGTVTRTGNGLLRIREDDGCESVVHDHEVSPAD